LLTLSNKIEQPAASKVLQGSKPRRIPPLATIEPVAPTPK
jgi:hypothetical protein